MDDGAHWYGSGGYGTWYDSSNTQNITFIGDGKASFADYDYEDDAARKNWGGTWRTPTVDEWRNLLDRNKYTWTFTYDEGTGLHGYVVSSLVPGYEGNSIFLPRAGSTYTYDESPSEYAITSYYWSSTLYSTPIPYAVSLYGDVEIDSGLVARCDGLPVRPVSD